MNRGFLFSTLCARLGCQCVAAALALWAVACANAAGSGFSAILGGSGQDYAAAVASDAQGNIYVAGLTYSPDFPVTAGALQSKIGSVGASDAFVAKFGPDGGLLWSTYLGGILDDWATGVAVDAAGNVVVSGWTRSTNFPVFHALQNTLNNGVSPARYDAFVAKLDPTGSRLIYSTFLGGDGDDWSSGLALDAAGNAYITGMVNTSANFPGMKGLPDAYGIFVAKLDAQGALVYSFLHPYGSAAGIAVDSAGSVFVAGTTSSSAPTASATKFFGVPGETQAMVFKLAPDGSKKLYETALGGSITSQGFAVAVDRAGAPYLAGITTSVDFPLVRPLQSSLGARPVWKSTDSGATWIPLEDPPFAYVQSMVVDPTSPDTIYAATRDGGLFKSADGGTTWNKANRGIVPRPTGEVGLQAMAIDPLHPQVLYVATGAAVTPGVVYKTVDGGNSWTAADSASGVVQQIAIDARNPNIVYTVWNNGVTRKTIDNGASWSAIAPPGTGILSLALDPQASGSVYAYSIPTFGGGFSGGGSPSFLYRSSDGGANWTRINTQSPVPPGLLVDPSTSPSTVYAGVSARSNDGGVTWTALPAPPFAASNTGALAMDPAGVLYAAAFAQGMYRSRDHGQTWSAIGAPPPATSSGMSTNVTSIVPAGATGTLFTVVQNTQVAGFVTKLSPDGTSILYSTMLGGHASMAAVVTYAAEPDAMGLQNWIHSIAVDAAGNLAVAGGTRASDFPLIQPAKPLSTAGGEDAFAAVLSADGSRLVYSNNVGGTGDDGALAIATNPQGDLIIAGQTWSGDYPVPGGVKAPAGQLGDVFVTRWALPAPPVVTSVSNAANYLPGIVAGSWVMIKGTNLASTNPGRTWQTDEVVEGRLPTSLDGVSVTINGKPAFVYYISPSQINVQAPSDSTVGPVDVIVTNNGMTSAPVRAQLQSLAPAFFQYPGTSYAVASLLPDYAAAGNPAVIPGTVAVKAGDAVVLWGTGFGATNPATPAGMTVTGAPATVVVPAVVVGGVPATVVSNILSAGSVGLYQLTIRIPQGVTPGAVTVSALSGGERTAEGVLIFVGQ